MFQLGRQLTYARSDAPELCGRTAAQAERLHCLAATAGAKPPKPPNSHDDRGTGAGQVNQCDGDWRDDRSLGWKPYGIGSARRRQLAERGAFKRVVGRGICGQLMLGRRSSRTNQRGSLRSEAVSISSEVSPGASRSNLTAMPPAK